ncbi:hypothetical protein AUR64_05205 [Haloprofundus marisrubri]|uniref:Uncharacterized protein n=1 Tax=Haloprofundus marisrubri TaxID=1514971 RepID=A0A0W1RDB3_9EURY|nr:hypothetical protein [Haloprofundus marisrubri]KTG11109.1 hypothetical protein AUR64_05205 [Haloprofundus marisrubri]
MFRAILPDGDMECANYEHGKHGVNIFTADEEFIAFIPYTNLVALINEEVQLGDEPSIAD